MDPRTFESRLIQRTIEAALPAAFNIAAHRGTFRGSELEIQEQKYPDGIFCGFTAIRAAGGEAVPGDIEQCL
ncbi:MAG: hypothetical protein J5654_11300 [Victivallales bacterium]|nr:hypothetical protein [Victivallales bacterium]